MAWTTPKTWTVGEMLTAQDLNKVSANLEIIRTPDSKVKKGDGSGNITTTTINSFVEMSSSLNITVTTSGNPVMIGLTGGVTLANGGTVHFDVDIDGTRYAVVSGTNGGVLAAHNGTTSGLAVPFSFTILTDPANPLSAGSHTFKPVFRTNNTGNAIYNSAAAIPVFWVREV